MAISINTSELENILDLTPPTQNILLVGRHGIGKSQILTQYFERKGMPVIALFLGQMSDPGDLIGLPSKDDQTGKTVFLPPYWFPIDGQPVVLFLDELNRARPEVLQTIMDLALNRKLAGRSLPPGSRIISAVNEGEEYQLTDLDPALVSRFNVYQFHPTVEEWLLWATQQHLDSRIIAFLQEEPSFLDGEERSAATRDTGLEKSPDRRAWQKVSDCLSGITQLTDLHKKLVAGIVGVQAASKFCAFAANRRMLGGKEVLLSFAKSKKTLEGYDVHQLAIVNESVFRFLETQTLKPKEKQTAKTGLAAYMDWLVHEGRKEATAHFASLFEKATYPNAILFMMTETPEVYQQIMKFISEL